MEKGSLTLRLNPFHYFQVLTAYLNTFEGFHQLTLYFRLISCLLYAHMSIFRNRCFTLCLHIHPPLLSDTELLFVPNLMLLSIQFNVEVPLHQSLCG